MPDPISTVIVEPLRKRIENDENALYRVVIELKNDTISPTAVYPQFEKLIRRALDEQGNRTEQHLMSRPDATHPYLKARLQGRVIKRAAELDAQEATPAIARIRLDLDDGQLFNPDDLVRTVISVPMLRRIEDDETLIQSVQIEVNFNYPGGRPLAKERVRKMIQTATAGSAEQFVTDWKTKTSEQYIYAKISGTVIRRIVQMDQDGPFAEGEYAHSIYHIWPDFKVRAQIWRSSATIKADACRRSFATTGRGIVWAVFDSGIYGRHPHFEKYRNLVLPSGLTHMDFTGPNDPVPVKPEDLTDEYGHGTHVAGIIAGELQTSYKPISLSREKDQNGRISYKAKKVDASVSGVAPECTLLSYKVLDKNGEGDSSTIIAAIQKIQELNGYGRQLIVHGVNMSLGYDFDPEWFACGQSPICVEVDRLARSGVAVVIAAGNTGKGFALTINDPGNAELAITVGSTHRDMPHRYGVSYFSSKGPTGDGRLKPDLLAPGERIISCGAGPDLNTYLDKARPSPEDLKDAAFYLERSGTSMAAPHVSGMIAGILSTRGEFVGLPEQVKKYLIGNATDLGRERSFQGGGLADMMRTIQAM